MKAKFWWLISEAVMVVLLGGLVVNWYVEPLPEWLIECIGVLLLVNTFFLVYTFGRCRKESKDNRKA